MLYAHACFAGGSTPPSNQQYRRTAVRGIADFLRKADLLEKNPALSDQLIMPDYEFITIWKVKSPQQKVWDLIFNSDRWPNWWRGVEKVEKLRDGDANHVGALMRYTWKSKLPYRLVFDMETTRVEPISLIEGRAIGELQGHGRWTLSHENGITTARYDWQVETTKAWMNLLAPVARPFFSWNHDAVMGWGGEGLAKQLGVKLVQSVHQ